MCCMWGKAQLTCLLVHRVMRCRGHSQPLSIAVVLLWPCRRWWAVCLATQTLHAGAGDSPSIKDAELKALDEALGGIVTEFVQIHEFAGKAVRASFPGFSGFDTSAAQPLFSRACFDHTAGRWVVWGGRGCMHIWRRATLRHAQPAEPTGMSARPAAGPPSSQLP